MSYDWIIEVLTDLRAYAALNGMDQLTAKVDEALDVARSEIAARQSPRDDDEG